MAELTQQQQEELSLLKARADKLGIPYKSNTTLEYLRNAIKAKLSPEPKEDVVDKAKESQDFRTKMFKEQMRLVRCSITNLNPAKRDLPGEIWTVANEYLGTVRKFVPYGEAGKAYHLPFILFNELKNRKYNSITKRINPRTKKEEVIQRMVPEFNIQELPPLTKEELAKLAIAQKAKHSIDDYDDAEVIS